MDNYEPIQQEEGESAPLNGNRRSNGRTLPCLWQSKRFLLILVVALFLALLLGTATKLHHVSEQQQQQQQQEQPQPQEQESKKVYAAAADIKIANKEDDDDDALFPLPSGVNFGSWLSLEDYFYVGSNAVEVATPFGNSQGHCLPPLLVNQLPSWQSETDLLGNLTSSIGIRKALQVFHAHRTSFITEYDLQNLQSLGIPHVRVPVSWCWTDADPALIDSQDDDNDEFLLDQFTCQDPYYENTRWPAIPQTLLVEFLRQCNKCNVTATLDIHTYPGATSIGTFSGLWPQWPLFWKHDHPDDKKDVGRTLLHGFVNFLEDLATTDPDAFAGLRGLSPMNEPAHLAGLFPPDNDLAFLPPLTKVPKILKGLPDGPHLRVLLWLTDAVATFRRSKLAQLGKELHVNIHESVLGPDVVPTSELDSEWNDPDAAPIQGLAQWWSRITSAAERKTWAVLDVHHYHAWSPECMGTTTTTPSSLGNYTCHDETARRNTLQRCTRWASMYRNLVDQECGPGAKLASAEFSASTNHKVRLACNDMTTLRETYLYQVQAAQAAQVELFWWSWKMPYGDAFRPAWSLKHFLYLMGVTNRPDTSSFECGVPLVYDDAPTDDMLLP